MGLFSGRDDDEAKRLRERSRDEDKASEDFQWHPTEGRRLAEESDKTWREAREKSGGGGGSNGDN